MNNPEKQNENQLHLMMLFLCSTIKLYKQQLFVYLSKKYYEPSEYEIEMLTKRILFKSQLRGK